MPELELVTIPDRLKYDKNNNKKLTTYFNLSNFFNRGA